MSKTTIVIIVYVLGLIFGALFLDLWSADTSIIKGLVGLGWTALLLIGLFFAEKNERNQIFNIMSSKRAMKQAQKQAYAKHRSNITNNRFGDRKKNFSKKNKKS